MQLMDAAARAVLVQLQAIRVLTLILGGRIRPLFALGAGKRDNDSCFIGHFQSSYRSVAGPNCFLARRVKY